MDRITKYLLPIFTILFSLIVCTFIQWKFYVFEKKIANNFEGVEMPVPASIERELNKSLRIFTAQTTKANDELKKVSSTIPISIERELNKSLITLTKQMIKANNELQEVSSILNEPKKQSEKYLHFAKDEELDFEIRNNLYIAALFYSENKDVILKEYISFVSNQINSLIDGGNIDDAVSLYDSLISIKDKSIASGTPENILNSIKYDELTNDTKDRLDKAYESKIRSELRDDEIEEIRKLESQMKFFREIPDSDIPLKLMLISRIKQELDSFIIYIAEAEKRISSVKNLEKLSKEIGESYEKVMQYIQRKETEEYNKKRKNYQRFALKNIYAFRKIRNTYNPNSFTKIITNSLTEEGKKKKEEDIRKVYNAMKEHLLIIDQNQLDYFVAKMFYDEREEGCNILIDNKLFEEMAKDEIKIKKITLDEVAE